MHNNEAMQFSEHFGKNEPRGDIFAEGRSWEAHDEEQKGKSLRFAWLVAGIGALIALVSCTGIAVMGVLHARPVPPAVMVINDETGEVQVLNVFSPVSVAGLDMVHKADAWKYVRSHEEYVYEQLNTDYHYVQSASDPKVWEEYAKKFDTNNPEGALDKRLGNKTAWRIQRISVTLPPDQPNTAFVHYKKTAVHYDGRPDDPPEYYVARLKYTYTSLSGKKESAGYENPVGFTVTSYVSDAEAAAPASRVAEVPPSLTSATQ
jgi:type IV secretion system protein VirB8